MSKLILKSNSAFVGIGESLSESKNVDKIRLFSLTQNCDFSISNNHIKSKAVGSEEYQVNDVFQAPQVNLNLEYLHSPYLNNELLLGFNGSGDVYQNALSGFNSKRNNFYLIVDNRANKEGFDEPRRIDPLNIDFSGFSIFSFGDCYLTNYSLNFNVGEIPRVNTSFACSNMKIDTDTGNQKNWRFFTSPSVKVPATIDLSGSYVTLTSGYVIDNPEGRTEYNLPVSSPRHSQFFLEDLQVGGIKLESSQQPLLQSLSINIDLTREDLYGLGSDYVYDRKLNYPINAKIDMSVFVSGASSGFISGILFNEDLYDFTINSKNDKNYATGFYQFRNCRLTDFSYSLPINNIFTFNASFDCSIKNYGGFLMRRGGVNVEGIYYQDLDDIWRNVLINWNSV